MELDRLFDKFAEKGMELVAVSANSRETAETSVAEWGIEKLPIGYGVDMEDAERWGLFASAAVKDTEPAHFVEPAIFVIRPDGTLYASILQTMPFSRPSGAALLSSLSWIIDNDYPPRGEYDVGG